MTKKRAFLETLLVSVIIPVIMFGAFLYALTWLRRGFFTFAVVFILLTLLYSAVVFFRHKELGGLFVFLTAVFSTLIQFVTGYVFLILFMSGISFDSGRVIRTAMPYCCW